MNLHAWLTFFTNSHVFHDTDAKKKVYSRKDPFPPSQTSSPALAQSGTLPWATSIFLIPFANAL